MIYQTGTITTTAGQTKIKGTGTRWKDNLAGISEGCPISYLINNVVYMNTVLSVNSDTEINLTYPVPVAATAAKYQIATFVLDSMSDGVRKMLANQQYIQYFLRNMDTWMTQDGIVEIKTPTGEIIKLESIIALKKLIDGKQEKGNYASGELFYITSNYTGMRPGNKSYAAMIYDDGTFRVWDDIKGMTSFAFNAKGEMITGLIPLACGGTGARTAVEARKSLSAIGIGELGIGLTPAMATSASPVDDIDRWDLKAEFHKVTGSSKGTRPDGVPSYSGFVLLVGIYGISGDAAYVTQTAFYYSDTNSNTYRRSFDPISKTWSKWGKLYSEHNTTKDTNGNLKAASPIIKVFADHLEINDESEGVELEKLGTGRYKLKGTLGMNSDASWGGYNGGLVAPLGINGLELLWVDYKVLSDGDIIIETNYRKHSDLPPPVLLKRLITYPEFMDENGDELESYAPVDIPNGHWIDVRVNMPSDSIYNQKLAEAERLAKLESERLAKIEAELVAKEEARKTAHEEVKIVLD